MQNGIVRDSSAAQSSGLENQISGKIFQVKARQVGHSSEGWAQSQT